MWTAPTSRKNIYYISAIRYQESKSNTSSISNISETSYLELEHETPEQES